MRPFFLLFSISIFHSCVTPSPGQNQCVGTGSRSAIYLHGVVGDQGKPQAYREVLTKFNEKLNLRLATPTGYKPCALNAPADKHCWHWGPETIDVLKERLGDIHKQSQVCFDNKQSADLYIGFSNGGGFLNRLFQDCGFKKEDTILAIGNGLGAYAKASYKGSLRECGTLILVIGKSDAGNQQQVQYAYDLLKARGAVVTILEYEGGHELNNKVFELSIFENKS